MSTPGDDLFADPYEVARDDELVENVRFGTPPVGWVEQQLTDFRNDAHREPLPAVSGWIEDPREPSGWRWVENLAELPAGTPHTVGPPLPYPDSGLPSPNAEPPAETAGEEDHSNPWFYAGEDASPPGAC